MSAPPVSAPKRFRPILLLVAIGLGVAGYFAATSSWEDLMHLKGAAWFGKEVEAKVVDSGKFTQMSWKSGAKDPDHKFRDHVRVKYEFEVDGERYEYPYEKGYCEVSKDDAREATIQVTYLPDNPKRNHPVGKSYKYADQMAGFVCGLLMLLTGAILLLVFLKSLVFGPRRDSESPVAAPSTAA